MGKNLVIKILGEIKGFQKKLGMAGKSVAALGKKVGITANTVKVGFLAIAAGIGAGIAAAVNEARKFETIAVQFEVLTGSAKQAKETIKELQEFSAKTPFQFAGIAKASQQLLGFGFGAEELIPKLQAIGDVASAIGKPIQEVGFIFGQVAAAGKLTGERLLQFQERAIPIGAALAKTMDVPREAIKTMVSEGKVSFKDFEEAFQSLSKEGGFAFEGMIKQSKTLDGILSTVGDNASLFANDIGKEFLPAIKNLALGFLSLLKSLRETDSFMMIALNGWAEAIENMAPSAKKTKEGLSEVDKELVVVNERLDELDTKIQEGKKRRTVFDVNNEKVLLAEFAGLLDDKARLEKEHAEKSVLLVEQVGEDKKAKQAEIDAVKNEALKKQAQEEAAITRQEQAVKLDAELEAIENDQTVLNEAELTKLQEKIDEKAFKKEMERIQELQSQGKHDEAVDAMEKLKFKKQAKLSKADIKRRKKEAKERKQIEASLLAASQNFLQLGIESSREGSRSQKNMKRASAVISTYAAANQALTSPPGPPWTLPLAASVVGLGLKNIREIDKQQFAHGGIVQGGIPGVDSVNILAQRGELISPVNSFNEVIGSVRAKREADKIGGGIGESQSEILIGFDGAEASQVLTIRQVEDKELGISRDLANN